MGIHRRMSAGAVVSGTVHITDNVVFRVFSVRIVIHLVKQFPSYVYRFGVEISCHVEQTERFKTTSTVWIVGVNQVTQMDSISIRCDEFLRFQQPWPCVNVFLKTTLERKIKFHSIPWESRHLLDQSRRTNVLEARPPFQVHRLLYCLFRLFLIDKLPGSWVLCCSVLLTFFWQSRLLLSKRWRK